MSFSWEKVNDLAINSLTYMNKQALNSLKTSVKHMNDNKLIETYNKTLNSGNNDCIEIVEKEMRKRGL